ncbi:hypothetical protein P8C59_000816 [Phyllachora maydis]|uniref:Nuclear-export cofactor Arc1-like N-terminal domain-containing protein n=1 Tax=Phyllachora maydis TaxID=1825666 RepID=A0AAD9HX24_9PEZI|nr:hypothetical protein P8C59_000816 [Phyllachora maydis]
MAPAPLVAHRFTKEDEDDLVKIWTAKAAILKASAQPPAPRRAAAASAHPVDRLGLWKTHNEDQLPAEMGALKARLGAAEDPSAILDTLDDYLEAKTTAAGSTPTPADVALYEALAPLVKTWGPDERTGELGRPHVVRLVGFVEKNPGLYGLTVPEAEKVAVDPQEEVVLSYRPVDYEKLEKEQKKKEKEVKTGGDRTHADRTQAAAGARPSRRRRRRRRRRSRPP